MVETLILLGGSALIMSGMFGLIEVAIQSRRSHAVQTAGVQRRHAPAPAEEPEATEVEERYLEFTVVRDREANPDGQSRQRIISDLEVGDAVVLVPETAENGGRDIRVVASAGTIGYVPPSRAAALLEMLAASVSAHSEISHVGQVDDVFSAWVAVAVRA
jgi:hypothetical protein